MVLMLVEMFQISASSEYLQLAECVADKMIRRAWYAPYFRPSIAHRYTLFDGLEPYALACLAATDRGAMVSVQAAGASSIYGNFLTGSGKIVNLIDSIHFRESVLLPEPAAGA